MTMTTDITTIEKSGTKSERANPCCSTSNRKEPTMSDFYDTARGLLADVLEPEFPEAATFLKAEKGRQDHCAGMQALTTFSNDYDVAYHAAVNVLWLAQQSDFQEAGDFLNCRNVRSIYFGRVGEEMRKADLEVERAKRDEVERRKRLKEKLDGLTCDGVLNNEEREELDRSPYFDPLRDEIPF
jgi:hypothetical protein